MPLKSPCGTAQYDCAVTAQSPAQNHMHASFPRHVQPCAPPTTFCKACPPPSAPLSAVCCAHVQGEVYPSQLLSRCPASGSGCDALRVNSEAARCGGGGGYIVLHCATCCYITLLCTTSLQCMFGEVVCACQLRCLATWDLLRLRTCTWRLGSAGQRIISFTTIELHLWH